MKKLFTIAAVAAAAAIAPTAALAGTFGGVVVGKAPGSLAVAARGGVIHTVRSHSHARIGARVRVHGSSVRVIGFAHRVRIHGVIVRRMGSTTFLAGGDSLLAVHSGRALSSAAGSPATGSVVNTTAQVLSNGALNAGSMEIVGEDASVQVQAVVTGIATGSITVDVSGQSLAIPLPSGIQLPATLVGQSVTLNLDLSSDQPTANPEDDQADTNDQGDQEDQGDQADQADEAAQDEGNDQSGTSENQGSDASQSGEDNGGSSGGDGGGDSGD